MIQSQEEFDAVLEEATHLMDAAPVDGSPQSRRLADVMGLLASYESFLESHGPVDDTAAAERAALVARAGELERKYRETSGPHVYADLHEDEHAKGAEAI